MAKVPETFNISDRSNLTLEILLELMERMYIDLAQEINKKPDIYERNVDGQASDTFLSNGSININTSTNKVEMITKHPTVNTVTWTTLG